MSGTPSGPGAGGAAPLWPPREQVVSSARITGFARFVSERHGIDVGDYSRLWAWSVEHLEPFWAAVWDFFAVAADPAGAAAARVVLADAVMPGARWFPGARLNYAEHALRGPDDAEPAVVVVTEDGTTTTYRWGELRAEVGALAGWLREQGVAPGDRVVGYLPNGVHAVVAFLACAGIGAVWSACGQDYAGPGAAARFAQLEPVVLVAADGYRWNGRVHDRRAEVETLKAALPTLRRTVTVSHVGLGHAPGPAVTG